jgi:hypothetical protein
VENFFLWNEHPFQCCVNFGIYKIYESNLQILKLLWPPLYHGLHIDLLKQSKVDLFKHVFESMWNFIYKYGTTICFNGWDNVVCCPLSNIVFTCPNGDVFVGAINTTKKHKDAQYLCNALAIYIDTLKC